MELVTQKRKRKPQKMCPDGKRGYHDYRKTQEDWKAFRTLLTQYNKVIRGQEKNSKKGTARGLSPKVADYRTYLQRIVEEGLG